MIRAADELESVARAHERRLHDACCGDGSDLPPRLALYRRLVRGNLLGVMQGVLPRTSHALGETLSLAVDRLLRAGGPRTPHLRDVPAEIVLLARADWTPWQDELARFELAEFRVSYQARELPVVTGALALDAPLALAGPLALESFTLAVQEPRARPDAHTLLFYRDADERVRTLRLTPMAAALLREVLAGSSVHHALSIAASECGLALDEPTLTSTAAFFDDLSERGVLLGAR